MKAILYALLAEVFDVINTFVVGMIILDISAPIFLMLGIKYGTSANASLLGNFEIVATTVIALFVFKEAVSK